MRLVEQIHYNIIYDHDESVIIHQNLILSIFCKVNKCVYILATVYTITIAEKFHIALKIENYIINCISQGIQ